MCQGQGPVCHLKRGSPCLLQLQNHAAFKKGEERHASVQPALSVLHVSSAAGAAVAARLCWWSPLAQWQAVELPCPLQVDSCQQTDDRALELEAQLDTQRHQSRALKLRIVELQVGGLLDQCCI